MTAIEVLDGREAQVGKFTVRRVLPTRPLRTVGAWCFADHMGPAEVTETSGLDVGPHPHTGLQTVTWLMSGEALHKDSLGSEQLIRPGQLNLMSAGRGIVHAEEATGTYRGTLHGVQLWVAQPDGLRHGDPDFAHHAELPVVEHGAVSATVLAGSFLGATSPAAFVTDLLGLDLVLRPGSTTLPLRPEFEHAVVALDGEVLVGGAESPARARSRRSASAGPRWRCRPARRPACSCSAGSRSPRSCSCGGTSSRVRPTRCRASTPTGATARCSSHWPSLRAAHAPPRPPTGEKGEGPGPPANLAVRIPAPTPPWETVRVKPAP